MYFQLLSFSCAQAQALAAYLSMVLQNKQLLSNKALHLFLQTGLSMQVAALPLLIDQYLPQAIRGNLEGLRDDEVVDHKIETAILDDSE